MKFFNKRSETVIANGVKQSRIETASPDSHRDRSDDKCVFRNRKPCAESA